MTYLEDAICAQLSADPALAGLLTGGLYTETRTGPLWLSRDNEAAAQVFDDAGAVKPCLFIRARGEQPGGGIRDHAPAASVRQVVELYFYQADAPTAIRSAERRAFQLLAHSTIGGAHLVWNGNPFGTVFDENALGGAYTLRSDYLAHSIRS